MRKWLVTACTFRSPRTSNAIATVPMSASTIGMNRAIRWGAKRCRRCRRRPGLAYAGSGLVVAIRSGYYPRGLRERRAFRLGAQLRLLKVDPESEPAERDSEQAAPPLGSSAQTSPSTRPDPGRRSPAARFGLGVAQLGSQPCCGTVDASLLIDEIDRRLAGRGSANAGRVGWYGRSVALGSMPHARGAGARSVALCILGVRST